MSTLPIRTLHMPQLWSPLPSVAHFVAFIGTVVDVLAEADRMAGAARTRYSPED